MKQISLLFIIVLSVVLYTACNNKQEATQDKTSSYDKETILSIIENESRDFYKKDHASWSNHYVQSPEVFWACVEKDVTLRANGWEDLSLFVESWMKNNPEPIDYDAAKFKITDVQVSISGDLAFVTMKSSNIQPDGSFRSLNANRTMKKIDGDWKILSMTSYPNDSPEGSTPNIYKHQ